MRIPQILEEVSDVTLTRSYTRIVLNDLVERGLIRKSDLGYSLVIVKKAKAPIKTEAPWAKELEIAQPIVRVWEPYIPPREIPRRPGADNHLKWKSLLV
jgi:hypothetical protein